MEVQNTSTAVHLYPASDIKTRQFCFGTDAGLPDPVAHLRHATEFALDLETSSLDPITGRIKEVLLCDGEFSWVLKLHGKDAMPYRKSLDALQPLLADPNKTMYGWNLKFDVRFLLKAGLDVRSRIADGMMGLKLLNETSRMVSLKDFVLKRFGYKMQTFEESQTLFGDWRKYCTDDAFWTWMAVREGVLPMVREENLLKLWIDMEGEVTKTVAEMENRGVLIERGHLMEMRGKLEKKMEAAEQRCYDIVGHRWSIGSPQACARAVYWGPNETPTPGRENDKLSLDYASYGKDGTPSTSEKLLKLHEKKVPIIGAILDFRHARKELTTYVLPYLNEHVGADGRVHADFKQLGTTTGRFSCSKPNLQNWPARPWNGFRKAFVAEDGSVLIQADFSQVELKLAAYVSGDVEMTKAFTEDGLDIHEMTRQRTQCGARRNAKVVNFGLLYMMSPPGLRENFARWGIEISESQAEQWHAGYHKAYPGMKKYFKRIFDQVKRWGYVETITGRRRRLPKSQLPFFTFGCKEHRELVNMPIQGSAGDIIKIAMRNMHRSIIERRAKDPVWERVFFLSMIHDELVMECPEEIAHECAGMLKWHFEHAVDLMTPFGRIPIDADPCLVRTWGESKLDDNERMNAYLDEGMDPEKIAWFARTIKGVAA